ncbi:MAG: ELM1/GtrOC1 family putative glycosyltransferase, partial [Pseudomonadota bacterium]
ADDNPHRGDVRAVRGIAKAIARKTGWRVDELTSETDYPRSLGISLGFSLLDAVKMDMRARPQLEGLREGRWGELWLGDRDHIRRVQSHIARHGAPEVVLATPSARVFQNIDFASTDHDATYRSLYQCDVVARDWAEKLSVNVGTGKRGDALVAHDLELEDFARAADEFRTRHPELTSQGPLVTLFYADHAHVTDVERRVVELLGNDRAATLVLCGAPRTAGQEQAEAFFAEQLPADVQLKSFRFEPEAAYNPYLGLVGASDHIIRRGISQSIDSEVFATGKSVHVWAPDLLNKDRSEGAGENPLHAQGYYRNLAAYGDRDRLKTVVQALLNVTDDLAAALLKRHHQTRSLATPSMSTRVHP